MLKNILIIIINKFFNFSDKEKVEYIHLMYLILYDKREHFYHMTDIIHL